MDIAYKIQKESERYIDKYQLWIYEIISPFLGDRILDAGCSIGNTTKYFLDKEFILGLDISKKSILEIRKKFKKYKNFKAEIADLSKISTGKLKQLNIDTITCINVLEHIRDDKDLLLKFNKILNTGGILILLVPAFNFLYGERDKLDNHFRRYDKGTLTELFKNSGFELKKQKFFNFFGIFGWFLNGKILKKEDMPASNLVIYNSLVPFFKKFESIISIPIGLSIIGIYEKIKDSS